MILVWTANSETYKTIYMLHYGGIINFISTRCRFQVSEFQEKTGQCKRIVKSGMVVEMKHAYIQSRYSALPVELYGEYGNEIPSQLLKQEAKNSY